MKVLAETIIHQQQPTPISCTATCIAMALGITVLELGVRLDTAHDIADFGVWLAKRGVWLRVCDRNERFRAGSLYIISARSFNIVGSDHVLLLDSRPDKAMAIANEDRDSWWTYDPNDGREGKKIYCRIDEHYAIDSYELKDIPWGALTQGITHTEKGAQ